MDRQSYRKYIGINDDISSDAADAFSLVNQGMFIEGLLKIGYAIATLSQFDDEDDYNCTDCITTAKALKALFAPNLGEEYVRYTDEGEDEVLKLLILNNNFIDITIRQLDYHRLIMVKLDKWYLMNSFDGEYTLRIIEVNPYNILADLSIPMYELLFSPLENHDVEYAKISLKFGNHDFEYRTRLLNWLMERINN